MRSKKDHTALQNDLNLLYEWTLNWQLSFNITKCKHIHFGIPQSYGSFFKVPNGILIDSVTSHKDLGITFDSQLKFHGHTTGIIAKANGLLGIIKKYFNYFHT